MLKNNEFSMVILNRNAFFIKIFLANVSCKSFFRKHVNIIKIVLKLLILVFFTIKWYFSIRR